MSSFKTTGNTSSYLRRVISAMNGPNSVEVGFFEGATYPDGTSLPMVAAINEFGGTINIPAHSTTLYRKVLKSGAFSKGGQFVKASKSNFSTTHQVPAHSVTIPSRPFFRNALKSVQPKIGPVIQAMFVGSETPPKKEKILKSVGTLIQQEIQESIRTLMTPPNAASTVARKGFNNPLIETGHMLRSVAFQIREDAAP